MKLRNRNDISKQKIQRKASFECIRSEEVNDPYKIPKLTIRRKTKQLSSKESQNVINTSPKEDDSVCCTKSLNNTIPFKPVNGRPIFFSTTLKKERTQKENVKLVDLDDTLIEIDENDNFPTLDFIPEQVTLNHDIVQSQITKSTKLSRGLNCEYIFSRFKKKLTTANQLYNNSLSPDSLESYSPYSKSNFMKLKDWLQEWKTIYNPEQKMQKLTESSDDSDFEPNKSECEMSHRSSYPFCIIYGNVGSGKTSLVHSIAKEMNFKVFEINSSQRRTGKDVMDVLDNLFTNHNVAFKKNIKVPSTSDILKSLDIRKRKATTLESFFSPKVKKSKTLPLVKRQESNLSIGKDSLFLFDDVDVVLEDDNGFLNSISTLIGRSKRPIILTCSDRNEMSKFLSKYNYQNYLEINLESSVRNIAIYIQMLLLSLNMQYDINELSSWIKNQTNRSTDVRFLINNIQFQSVCQMKLIFTSINEFLDWSEMRHLMDDKSESDDDDEYTSESIRSISNYMRLVSTSDSYLTASKRTEFQLERMGNLDKSAQHTSYYDQGDDLKSEIEKEIITRSSILLKDHELVDRPTESMIWDRKYSSSIMPCLVNQRSILKDCCIRTQVTSRHSYVDRLDALMKIAISEAKRKENNTERRFRHYFQRLGLNIPSYDLHFLENGYK